MAKVLILSLDQAELGQTKGDKFLDMFLLRSESKRVRKSAIEMSEDMCSRGRIAVRVEMLDSSTRRHFTTRHSSCLELPRR